MLFKDMLYTLHVVESLRYDSVLIKETNERVTKFCGLDNLSDQIRRKFLHGRSLPCPAPKFLGHEC